MPFHVSYGVACGERTVAACCEIKTGYERVALTFGLQDTRNAVAPPLGPLNISGPNSSHESGTVCLAPHCRVQGERSQILDRKLGPNFSSLNQAVQRARQLG